MENSSDKANMPWSVKGVSKEAREVVKKGAAADGVTIGEWLSRVIRETDEVPPRSMLHEEADSASTRTGNGGEIASSPAGSAENLRDNVVELIRDAEDRIIGVVEPVHEIVKQLARRVETLERGEPEVTPVRQQVQKDPLPPTFRKINRD